MASILDDPNRDASIRAMAQSIINGPAPAAQPKRNLFAAGISSGIDQMQALGGRAIQAGGDAIGSQTVSDFGKGIADRNFAEAAANGRPDLESRPDLAHWTDYPAWLGYQASKQLPTLAAALVAYKLGGKKFAAAIPEELASVGASVPKFMGGGGLRAGATLAEQKAAQAAGAQMVAGIASQAPVMYPQAVGSMYDEAVQSGTAGQGAAVKALGMGVPYSLMEGFEPGSLSGMVKSGLAGGALKRMGTGALVSAATETVTEGVQTGMEQTFRPDLTPREKMANIIEGAITGGAVGGLFGGVAGMLGGNSHVKKAPPSQIGNPELAKTVDNALGTFEGGLNMKVHGEPIGPPSETRPLAGLSEKDLLARLTIIQQQEMAARPQEDFARLFGTVPEVRSNPQASLIAQQINHELDIRQGRIDPDTPAPNDPAQAELLDINKRVNDGTATAQDLARARMLQEGPVEADTSQNTAARSSDLFSAQSIPLEEQLSPEEQARREEAAGIQTAIKRKLEGTAPVSDAVRTAQDEDFYGKTTASWAADARATNPKDHIDRVVTVIDAINAADSAKDGRGRALTKSLKDKAEEVGYTNKDGSPRDLQAEVNDALLEYSTKLKTATTTGTEQSRVAVDKFAKETLTPLRQKLAALQEAQKRIAKRAPATPTAAQDAPAPNTLLGIPPANPGTSTPDQTAATIQAAPLPAAPLSFADRFRGAGAPNTNANVAEELPAPAAAPVPPSKVADMGQVSQRWAQGKVGQTQAERVAAREAAASAPAAVNPAAIPNAVAQGTAFSPAGRATPVAQDTQYVTKADLPAPRRRGGRQAATVPVIPTNTQAQGTSFAAEAPVAPRPASDIGQVGVDPRADLARQATMAELADLATNGEGTQWRNAASETLAKMEALQGGDADAQRILQGYAKEQAAIKVRGGRVVFSRRDPNTVGPPMSEQDFSQALNAATRKLPTSVQSAINVVKTVEDLPREVLAAAEHMGFHPSEIRGVLHDDTVYVVQDHISSQAELDDVIAHEVFGHGGARALFGDRRVAMLSTAFKLAGDTEGLRRTVSQFGISGKEFDDLFPARALTDQDRAQIVDEVLAMAAGRAGGKFKTAVLAWVGTFKGMLIRALRAVGLNQAAERLNKFDAATFAATMSQMKYAVEMGGNLGGGDTVFSRATVPATPDGMNESTQNLMTSVGGVENWFHSRDWSSLSLKANQLNLYTSSAGHIVDTFGPLFEYKDAKTGEIKNPLKDWWEANRLRGVTEQRLAHLVQVGHRMFERVAKNDPKGAKKIGDLMGYTSYNIDPAKTWEEQGWLHPLDNAEALKKHVQEANRIYRDLRQNHAEAAATYDAFHQTNEGLHFAQQAVSLYNLMMLDNAVPEGVKEKLRSDPAFGNPMEQYLQMEGTYDNPKASRDYWYAYGTRLMDEANKYVEAQRGLAAISDEGTRTKLKVSTSSIAARIRSITQERDAMAQSPYFHLGRFGDYVLSFHVKKDAKGNADPVAMDRIVTAFRQAGIEGIEIPVDATRPNAFMRFENKTKMDEARRVAEMLAGEGHVLNQITGLEDGEGDKRIKTFSREHEQSAMAFQKMQSPEWANDLMDRIKAEKFGNYAEMTEGERKLATTMSGEFERYVRQYFLNLLPDTAVTKVMVHRNNVPGYSSDMIRSYLFRTQVGGRALANLYASARMSDARKGMIDAANEAKADSDTTKAMLKQNVVNELFTRDAQRPLVVRNNFIDTWRAVNHAYFLGMSPSYMAVNMTQLGVLLWPELSKRFGFIPSAKAIGKVTPKAMKIMAAVIKEGGKLGWNNLPDASISREVLSKVSGLTEADINFIMRVVNSGVIDIGSQSRELGRVVEGSANSKMENALRWASAAGYYSEMTSRLIAAMSARELHGGNSTNEEMYKYVDETVRQSMLSYETWNQARATGRMGLAGPMTPVMTSFLQYTFQLTEKLYREMTRAFGKAAKSAEERTASRKFMAAHLGAVTLLTGTLGMPMASVFAKAFDSLSDVFGDDDEEPSDIRTSYRNWLEFNLGKDVAEVVARGLPRAFGADISQRAGEQDILPFAHMVSKLMTDRGKWDDRVKDWGLQTLGSPVSMVSSIIGGGSKMMAGDFKAGLLQAVPTAIKGPAKAYYLAQSGYVDAKGNQLPMDAPATDVLWQALGFNTSRKAEYSEERGAQAALKGDRYRRAQILRNDLAQAIEAGDPEAIQDAAAAAQRFDSKNPDFQVMPTIASVVRSRARERLKAAASDSPLGTKPGLVDRTAFGNLD